jgi:hypothetical protein
MPQAIATTWKPAIVQLLARVAASRAHSEIGRPFLRLRLALDRLAGRLAVVWLDNLAPRTASNIAADTGAHAYIVRS